MTLIPMICATCQRLIYNKNTKHPENPYTCEAFPSGIPPEILFDGWDHSKYPFSGDNGIMYQKGEPTIIEVIDAP